MTRMFLTLLCLIVGGTTPFVTTADVLLIEEVRQAGRMNLPQNGASKREVEEQFGAPLTRHAPVGDPPISRWEYERWSVYFEYDKALFTVLHKGHEIENDP